MDTKDIADLFIEAVGKIEFYWNFYTVTILALIGWLVSAKTPLPPRLKAFITIGFLAFTVMNLLGLWGSYAFTEALRLDLLEAAPSNVAHTREALGSKDFLAQRTIGVAIHFTIDAFAIFAIWKTRIGNAKNAEQVGGEE